MNLLVRHALARNAMFVMPLALPIAFVASTEMDVALLFAATILATVPLTHALSWGVEHLLPRYLRIVSVLVIGAAMVTIAELIIRAGGLQLAERPLLLLRSLVVSGLTVWPTITAPRGQRFGERLAITIGLVLGFLGGFIPFAVLRVALLDADIPIAASLGFAFLVIAFVRIAINLTRTEHHEAKGEHRS